MKILFFIHGLYGGGAERIASILLNHFCEKHDTYVAITDFKSSPYPIDKRVHIIDDRIKSKIKGASRIPRFAKMALTIKKINPSVIISFLTKTNNQALTANILFGKKIIVSERCTLTHPIKKKQKIFRKILYPLADKIVFVTSTDANSFKHSKKCITIENPAMFDTFSDYANRDKTIITIASSRRWHIKGIDLLIKAWNKIASRNPDWNVKIQGRIQNDNLPEEITRITKERVVWAGWTDNIKEPLQTASIFALLSRNEACPNSLIEAMSQGCACLGSDCDGGMKEIITNGIDGLIAKNEDIDDIAQKLQTLIDDENLRRKLSAGAIEKVKEFDKNVFFAKWDELIENVVRK